MKSINISDHKITNQITLKQLPTSINLDANNPCPVKPIIKKTISVFDKFEKKLIILYVF